jgi:hypothetical protein
MAAWPIKGDGKMRRQIAGVLCSPALGAIAISPLSLAIAPEKTAKACVKKWQADKGAQAAG